MVYSKRGFKKFLQKGFHEVFKKFSSSSEKFQKFQKFPKFQKVDFIDFSFSFLSSSFYLSVLDYTTSLGT